MRHFISRCLTGLAPIRNKSTVQCGHEVSNRSPYCQGGHRMSQLVYEDIKLTYPGAGRPVHANAQGQCLWRGARASQSPSAALANTQNANHGRGQQDENEKQERFHKGGAVTARTFFDFGLPEIWESPTGRPVKKGVIVTRFAQNRESSRLALRIRSSRFRGSRRRIDRQFSLSTEGPRGLPCRRGYLPGRSCRWAGPLDQVGPCSLQICHRGGPKRLQFGLPLPEVPPNPESAEPQKLR